MVKATTISKENIQDYKRFKEKMEWLFIPVLPWFGLTLSLSVGMKNIGDYFFTALLLFILGITLALFLFSDWKQSRYNVEVGE